VAVPERYGEERFGTVSLGMVWQLRRVGVRWLWIGWVMCGESRFGRLGKVSQGYVRWVWFGSFG
jgi:hypothetical protein